MSTQPTVIQWSAVQIDLSKEAGSGAESGNKTMKGGIEDDKNERTIMIPIKKNIDLNSQDSKYLDVKIEVLSDSKSCFDDIDSDPNTEYLNVRIEVEPNLKVHSGVKPKFYNEKSFKIKESLCSYEKKLLAKDLSSSSERITFKRKETSSMVHIKPFKCDSCGKCFTTKQHLERHANLHSMEILYPCPECDKVLLDKSYLLRHMRVHAGVKPFKCSICQKNFRTACSLKRHETMHDPSSRPFICADCDKRFPDQSSLKKHSHTHSGVKTHVCIICAKGFSHVGDYNLHMKGHDIVKQYHCDQCGKEFSRHNNLLRHKAVHTSDNNFQCVICEGCFQHASTLTRHILSCHPEAARVKKKKSRQADTLVSGNTFPQSISHEDEVSVQVPENTTQNASVDDLTVQVLARTMSSQYMHESDAINEKVTAVCLGGLEEKLSNASNAQKSNDNLVELSSSSFEIYQFDACGTLVRMTDNLPFQVLNTCVELGEQPSLQSQDNTGVSSILRI